VFWVGWFFTSLWGQDGGRDEQERTKKLVSDGYWALPFIIRPSALIFLLRRSRVKVGTVVLDGLDLPRLSAHPLLLFLCVAKEKVTKRKATLFTGRLSFNSVHETLR